MTTDERPPAERLLAAAEELFGERSYGRTTVADICARAGMATGSFYAYFDSKLEIFAAVVRGINHDLRRAMAIAVANADDNQRARERAAFRAFFDLVSKRPWIDRIVRESEFVAPGLFREYYEQLARGYARGVRVAQLAGEVDARYDPEVIAYIYTGIGNFVGMRWADWTAGGRVPEDVLDDVLELFARGLAPDKSQSTPLARTVYSSRESPRAASCRAARTATTDGRSLVERRAAVKTVRRGPPGRSMRRTDGCGRPCHISPGISATALPEAISATCTCRSAVS